MRLFILVLLLTQSQFSSAQLWTWMGGGNGTSSVAPVSAVYGTLGIASSSNYPGATTNAATWMDASGNFWMFGGSGSFSASASSNDLWKYNVSTNEWTWMHGSATANNVGSFGVQGVASSTNMPSGRSGSCSWVDASGNFWLFGGFGYTSSGVGHLNDLWKYAPGTNQWTWISGSTSTAQNGLYGTMGVSNATVYPGGRSCYSKWSDASGNLWLFGGQGYAASGGFGYLKDLWKYNIASNQWTWMGGSNGLNQAAQYGTQSVASSTNSPGARNGSAVWKDASGFVWLYGGNGYASSSSSAGSLSDLWKYDITNNQWTWVRGSSGLSSTGLYGTMGVGNATTTPGGRAFSAVWPEINGDLYMFGGSGQNANTSYVHLNDIWKYSVSNNIWTWVNGNDQNAQTGVYGVQGLASTLNMAGSKQTMAAFKDASNNLWTFGGSGSVLSSSFVVVNELWKYELCSTPAVPVNTTVPARQNICAATTTTLTVLSDAPATWYTNLTGSVSLGTGSTLATPVLAAGTYSYFAEAKLCNASATRATLIVTVNPNPTLSVVSGSICSGDSYTLSPSGAFNYTYSGGSAVVSPVNTSTYLISGTSSFGCPATNSVTATVSVNQSPTVTITGTNGICFGSTVTLTANGALTYSWTGGTNTNSLMDTPLTSTTYSVSGENQYGCIRGASIAVSVYSLPVIAVNDGTICSGNVFTLNPSGAASYSFSGGNQVVSPLTNSSFTITGFSVNNCKSTNTVIATVVVNALPVFTLSGSSSVCKGLPVTLLVNGSAVTYTWSNGSNANLVVFTPTISTSYSVSVTGTNGCRDSASKFVTVNPLPMVMANGSATLICEGKELLLFGSGAATYSWTNGVINNISFTPQISNSYTVTGVDVNGCENSNAVQIDVAPLPTVTIMGNLNPICAGEKIILTASGASTYSWSTGDSTFTMVKFPTITSTYTVIGTSSDGCSAEFSATQLVNDCTGLGDLSGSESSISGYPNPTNGMFNLEIDPKQGAELVEVYNLYGERLVSQKYTPLDTKINLMNFASGIYEVVILKSGRVLKKLKVIKE
ncbi:hypothetical protein CNR22_22200 [Sphingobacteriaceae bacterium]|nr:hypothetical protein CNR22_22200 [Sphingobacteriaceae bacterium]